MSSTNREVLEALRTAFPQLFTRRDEDGVQVERIDLEKIRLLAGDGNYSDKFGLRWEPKPEKFEAESVGQLPTLKRLAGKRLLSTTTEPAHVLIQGDNCHALKVLAYTHERAVDVIYIDPPYNTGNKDFKYNDRFVDKEDGYRHSKWLSFMEKRLRLAKGLLKATGAVLISIDDNEYAQLKLLCDSILGEEHYHGTLTWHKRTKPVNSGQAKFGLQQNVEYVLLYTAKSKSAHRGFLLDEGAAKAYPHVYKGQPCRFENLLATDHGRKKRDTMKFPILGVCPPQGKRWQVGEAQARILEQTDAVALVDGLPKRVVRSDDEPDASLKPFWSHLSLDQTGSAETGKALLTGVVGEGHGFDTVKPLDLMTSILRRFPLDAVVLDFFAGSGTTAHAVMQLNAEDGGRRQCILVTNDEGEFKDDGGALLPGGICSHVTYPRLKKVIEGYTTPKGKEIAGLGANLEFFQTAFLPVPRSRDQMRSFVRHSSSLLCLKAGCFTSVEDDARWSLFTGSKRHLFILYDDCACDAALERLRAVQGPVDAYVFAYDSDDDSAEVLGQLPNVKVQEVPRPLLDLFFRLTA